MSAWRWTVSGRDALHHGSSPRDHEDRGVVEAESVAEAAAAVVRDEIEWVGIAAESPVTITLAPVMTEPQEA